MTTPNLQLSEVTAADTPAAASLNDSFLSLDAVCQLAVISQEITAPPEDAVQGDRYIVPDGAGGAWFNRTHHIAYRTPTGWAFRVPRPGWRAWLIADAALLYFTGTQWAELETGGGSGGGNVTPDSHPAVADAADDEFEFGTSIDTAGARFGGATAWAAFNVGSGTNAVKQGSLALRPELNASRDFGGYMQAVSGTWDYRCKMMSAKWTTNALHGIAIATASGTAGNIIIFGLNGPSLIVQQLTNVTTFNANSLTAISLIPVANSPGFNTVAVYLRVTFDGTDLRFYFSMNGADDSYTLVNTQTAAGFLGTPTTVGLLVDNQSATDQSVAVFDWFRRYA